MRFKRWKKPLIFVLAAVTVFLLGFYLLQRFWAHRTGQFIPDYPKITLTETSDHETIFLQTGLGRSAVDKLLTEGNFQAILDAQNRFFDPPKAVCTPLLGWFTREDRLESEGTPLADLQPGDILLTLSTHTAGWHHGHAGLVIDSDTVLECVTLGTDSALVNAGHWNRYSNYAVVRLKDITPELQNDITAFALDTLTGVPYRLTAGLWGEKSLDPEEAGFGLHCAYLVWYAYDRFGYDLDSDGGRLVSTADLLNSHLVEVVQVYGMDPRDFSGGS